MHRRISPHIGQTAHASEEESVQELARILGGARITDTVLESAREMKELAESMKKMGTGLK